jgi:DNA-binding NtrC family response regulator
MQANSGVEAVSVAARESFDVVLMDIKMPGMDGVEAFKAMKASNPDIRVILMTAYTAEDRIGEARREGVLQVLSKPVDVPTLLQLLTAGASGDRPVLLIDQDAEFLHDLSAALRERGLDVVHATDLAQATRVMAEKRSVAVLLHMHVDSWSVREAVLAVRRGNPSLAFILHSGNPDTAQLIDHALPEEWVHAYLQKPFDLDQVTGVLDAIRSRS